MMRMIFKRPGARVSSRIERSACRFAAQQAGDSGQRFEVAAAPLSMNCADYATPRSTPMMPPKVKIIIGSSALASSYAPPLRKLAKPPRAAIWQKSPCL